MEEYSTAILFLFCAVALLTVLFEVFISYLKQKARLTEPDIKIGPEGNPYMLRWYVIPRNRFLNIYLHRFLQDDLDRAPHDHPWVNLTYMIEGRYYEQTFDVPYAKVLISEAEKNGLPSLTFAVRPKILVKRVDKGSLTVRLNPRKAHRIILSIDQMAPDELPLTLFVTGPIIRNWGFWCHQKVVHGYYNDTPMSQWDAMYITEWIPFNLYTDARDHTKPGKGCEQ